MLYPDFPIFGGLYPQGFWVWNVRICTRTYVFWCFIPALWIQHSNTSPSDCLKNLATKWPPSVRMVYYNIVEGAKYPHADTTSQRVHTMWHRRTWFLSAQDITILQRMHGMRTNWIKCTVLLLSTWQLLWCLGSLGLDTFRNQGCFLA